MPLLNFFVELFKIEIRICIGKDINTKDELLDQLEQICTHIYTISLTLTCANCMENCSTTSTKNSILFTRFISSEHSAHYSNEII